MKTKKYIIKNTFNGSYLIGAEYGNFYVNYFRYWGEFRKAKKFESRNLAQDIADSCDFGRVEEIYVGN